MVFRYVCVCVCVRVCVHDRSNIFENLFPLITITLIHSLENHSFCPMLLLRL